MNKFVKVFFNFFNIFILCAFSFAEDYNIIFEDKSLQQEYEKCLKVEKKYKTFNKLIDSLKKENNFFILLSIYNEDWGAFIVKTILNDGKNGTKNSDHLHIDDKKLEKILKHPIFKELKPFMFFSGGKCSMPTTFYRITFFQNDTEYNIFLNQTKINKFNRESQFKEYTKFIKQIKEICDIIEDDTILRNIYYP